MPRQPKDAIEKRLWITLIVLMILLVAVVLIIVWLGG